MQSGRTVNQVQAGGMTELSEQQIIDQLAGRLTAAYQHLDPTTMNRVVREEFARFEGRPIREFIPLFVERNAKAELSKPG
jgi:hypothetical protein